jgi:hypothetical protein
METHLIYIYILLYFDEGKVFFASTGRISLMMMEKSINKWQ